jgi:nicotinamidase/pyrazinamidase
MSALILVDLQNDFLPGGALAIPQGDAVLPLANQLQLQGNFRCVVATQDWHPANHKSFATNHPGRKPGDIVKLRNGPQTLWPTHCVQNTRGAELASNLMLNRVNRIFKKGTDAEIDSYSGFFDNGHEQPSGLHTYLREKRIAKVYVLGLATDYCVKYTALDAVDLGFKTFLIEDACRGVNLRPDDISRAIEEMKGAGVIVVHSREFLSP